MKLSSRLGILSVSVSVPRSACVALSRSLPVPLSLSAYRTWRTCSVGDTELVLLGSTVTIGVNVPAAPTHFTRTVCSKQPNQN